MKKRSGVKRLAGFVLRGGRRHAGSAGPLEARPRCVLFDFDGTLGDTFEAGVEILNTLAGEFGFRGLPQSEVEHARDLSTRELMRHLGIPQMKLHRISKRGTEEITKRIMEINPLPGVTEMLRELNARDISLGVLTSNSEQNVRTFLSNHDLEVFDFIKSSSKLLGKSRVLRAIMKEFGYSAREILFVGDELRDIEAAQETGVHMAAVTWGYNSTAALEAAGPDYLIADPMGICRLVEGGPTP
jgi:phosphoglycolate phosphatase